MPAGSPSGEASYIISNAAACRPPLGPITPDPVWGERGAAAYSGLARSDPQATWMFQGWAIIDWDTREQGSSFYGFVNATPAGKFIVVDMSVDGTGEWQKWSNARCARARQRRCCRQRDAKKLACVRSLLHLDPAHRTPPSHPTPPASLALATSIPPYTTSAEPTA